MKRQERNKEIQQNRTSAVQPSTVRCREPVAVWNVRLDKTHTWDVRTHRRALRKFSAICYINESPQKWCIFMIHVWHWTYASVCVYVCICTWEYIIMCTMWICVHIYDALWVYMHICTWYIYIHSWTYKYIYTYIHIFIILEQIMPQARSIVAFFSLAVYLSSFLSFFARQIRHSHAGPLEPFQTVGPVTRIL